MTAGDPGSPKRYYTATAVETSLNASIPAQSQGATYTSFIMVSNSGYPTSYPFTVIVDPDTSKEEVITVTAGTGTTYTVIRGEDNTQAVAHAAGATVRHGVSARDFREEQVHIASRGYDTDSSIMANVDSHVHGIGSGDGVVVGTTKTQTLTNKTLVSPTITAGAGAEFTSIVFEGTTIDANETTLTVVDPTADRTITLPDATGQVVLRDTTDTLTNKTLTSPTISGSPVITGLSSAGMVSSSATPKDYVDSILGSATAASTSAASAAASASAAATSASSASASASAAATSASSASTSATSAATSASSASASASAAATSASSASVSASTAQDWAIKVSGPVSGSDYSAKYNANLAATSATSAANSVSTIATYATNASSSASAAATSASSASTSASSAATSASAAATSAASAATSATSAATSASSAATTYAAYDQRYLGSKSSAPTLDNQGNALITGATYWNTSTTTMYVWSGTSWQAISSASAVTNVLGTAGRISSTGGTAPTLDLITTAVTAGTYKAGDFTVDAYGRLTAASTGTSASTSTSGIVQLTDSTASTSITTAATPNSVKTAYDTAAAKVASVTSANTARITIGGTSTAPTVDLTTSGVTANSYTAATITVDAYGRVTSATATTPYSAPTLGSTSIGSGATVSTITGLTENNLTLSGTLTASATAGIAGQVLTSTGTGVQWAAASGGASTAKVYFMANK